MVETVIQRTKLLLKEKGLKQKYLFEQIGKSPVLFNDWKNGKSKPTDEVLKNIADVLDTTPEYLLGKTDRKSKPHISEEYLKLIEEREAHTALVMGFGGDRQIIEVPEGAEEVILATIEAWRKKQAEENKKK
ncbi:MAG: helix-turn-helix domain-containing protein [Clostridiales bacterium]|nr:helix-turn-helix domain-containing protein [Clostridiales bacterium]MBD8959758.1 helix-turn-helix domain-containing protein [Clostridiales bacterium]